MKKQFCVTVLASIVFFTNCSKKENLAEEISLQYIEQKKADTLKEKNYIAIFDSQSKKKSTLSELELKLVSKNLIKAVDEYNVSLKIKLEKWNKKSTYYTWNYEKEKLNLRNYYRQYFISTNKNGDKIISIFCFCSYTDDSWRHQKIQVFDGGTCYLNIEINLTKNSYSIVQTHGLA